eukprot:558285-Alexandrium_andersonii.AAC.1
MPRTPPTHNIRPSTCVRTPSHKLLRCQESEKRGKEAQAACVSAAPHKLCSPLTKMLPTRMDRG